MNQPDGQIDPARFAVYLRWARETDTWILQLFTERTPNLSVTARAAIEQALRERTP